MWKYIFSFLISIFVVSEPLKLEADELQEKINKIITESPYSNAIWSLSIKDEKGNTLLDLDSYKLMIPASNMKLLSSATVLKTLGPNFRYSTKIVSKGKMSGNVWYGDIYIIGSGDPSINGDFYGNQKDYVFENFLTQLKLKGIKRIEGNLIANDAYFEDENLLADDWVCSDLSFYYAVETSSLAFNKNCIDLTVTSKAGEKKPKVQWYPRNTNFVSISNEQSIAPNGTFENSKLYRKLGTNEIVLKGSMQKGLEISESISITNPSLFFADSLQKYLSANGLAFNGKVMLDHLPRIWNSDYELLASYQSPQLSELLKRVNKHSDNFYAEMLLKTAATEATGKRGSLESGLKLVKDYSDELELTPKDMSLHDASGLSKENLLTTQMLTDLLVKMKDQPNFQYYEASLAVPQEDGSLRKRFQDSPVQSHFIGKTGYVNGVRALSGYMTAKSGQEIVVSLITNHFIGDIHTIDEVHEKIYGTIYETL
jgi:D-alanyl-D-alanine carboxypeptidase/D-alanyl-D-alanine-endopeptidase (penicillin-binding protein 4)